MMVISKTPYRLSLFGGGTDYPSWFYYNPSKIISAAMQHYCYITIKDIPPFFEYNTLISYSKIERVKSIDEIKHPSARECLRYMDVDCVSVLFEGDLPSRTGIGSSSSFTVGLLNALYAYKDKKITKFDLANEAINLEQEILKENVGIQDQIMASYGGIRIVEMGPGNKWRVNKMYMAKNYLKELESHIMLGFSGVSRYAEDYSKKQVEDIKQGKSEIELRTMVALTDDAIDSISREEDMYKLGNLLNFGWKIKRKLIDGIKRNWIDDVYEQSLSSGSLGGKLMGAGGGGFFMFLVPPQKQEDFKKNMKSIKVWVPFKFDTEGSQIIHYIHQEN